MKVKSTGLGKTQLTAHFDGFSAKEGGEASAVLVITSTEPVHWHIECDLGGNDLRRFAAQVLRPGMIVHLLKLLVRGGEARGFVMENEGGRRSRRERVSRNGDGAAGKAVAATTAEKDPAGVDEAPVAATVATTEARAAAAAAPAVATTEAPAAPAVAPVSAAEAAVVTPAFTPESEAAAGGAGSGTAVGASFLVRPRPVRAAAAEIPSDREERERRRAERRRQREEAARQYAAVR